MARYRKKKPSVVEATQWLGFDEGPHDLGVVPAMPGKNLGWIDTLGGGCRVNPGSWIITDVHGDKYICSPSLFESTYEEVSE